MKKLFIITILTLVCINANAQFFTGVSFDIKWSNRSSTSTYVPLSLSDNIYSGVISPQLGYMFNERFMAGSRFNFNFEKSHYYLPEEEYLDTKTKYVTSSIGWDLAPFCRYKVKEFGKNGWFSIWADLHAYFGRMYPVSVSDPGYVSREFTKKYIYGIQAMPSLGFRINDHSTLFINFAILSLAYAGTYAEYDGYVDKSNDLVLFTGKLNGLFTTMLSEGMYGIKFGMIRTFKQK